jgi:hypothetical protein
MYAVLVKQQRLSDAVTANACVCNTKHGRYNLTCINSGTQRVASDKDSMHFIYSVALTETKI